MFPYSAWMVAHVTRVGRGSAGLHFVMCDACDFNPRWEPLEEDARRWAREHEQHPDRDVSGIWAWSEWRLVDGVNHAFPFGAAACGVGAWLDADGIGRGPAGTLHDPQAPICPACDAMAPPDRDRP